MKFDSDDCWKHENCLDVFFFVHSSYQDDGKTAHLVGHWLTQGIESHWMVSDTEKIFINEEEYPRWHKYNPIGMFI